MKTKFRYLIICLFSLAMISCNKDFLETSPTDEFSEDAVWSDPALVDTYINNLYFRLYEPLTDGRSLSNIVDEGHYRGNAASLYFNQSRITQDDIPAWSYRRYMNWSDLYKSIRSTNVFFTKIDDVDFPEGLVDGKNRKDRAIGEAHFLRAYFYHFLVNLYGGVPVITDVYGLNDTFDTPRNTFEESINFIIEELDTAIALLPHQHSGSNFGRATRGAAMSLKSRVLTYAASDLYNNNPVFSSYPHPELVGYTSGDPRQRWQAARDASKAVIDLGQYELYKDAPADGDDIPQNLSEIFTNAHTVEDIFVKFSTTVQGQRWGLYTSPNGYYGWGVNAPTGEMVDAFERIEGDYFDWSNPVHASDPYADRDPRFYSTILFNGASWRERPADVKGLEPSNIVQTGTYKRWDAATGAAYDAYGVDTRNSPIENWNGSYTGYYTRKYLDPSLNVQYVRQAITWRFIRYAEILLNYAEASIELGEEEEASRVINLLRRRAGMPEVSDSGDALRARYRNERRVELAFEDHRFFDVRRWVIGPEAYGDIHVARVVYPLLADRTTSEQPVVTHEFYEKRSWENKAYLLPIFRDELNKNKGLIQNPGY